MPHLADYYVGMTPPSHCVACHGKPGYPRLAGQHAAYMAGQLRLRKNGACAPATEGAAVVAAIAQRLGNSQIDAVSAYFATLQPSPRELHVP